MVKTEPRGVDSTIMTISYDRYDSKAKLEELDFPTLDENECLGEFYNDVSARPTTVPPMPSATPSMTTSGTPNGGRNALGYGASAQTPDASTPVQTPIRGTSAHMTPGSDAGRSTPATSPMKYYSPAKALGQQASAQNTAWAEEMAHEESNAIRSRPPYFEPFALEEKNDKGARTKSCTSKVIVKLAGCLRKIPGCGGCSERLHSCAGARRSSTDADGRRTVDEDFKVRNGNKTTAKEQHGTTLSTVVGCMIVIALVTGVLMIFSESLLAMYDAYYAEESIQYRGSASSGSDIALRSKLRELRQDRKRKKKPSAMNATSYELLLRSRVLDQVHEHFGGSFPNEVSYSSGGTAYASDYTLANLAGILANIREEVRDFWRDTKVANRHKFSTIDSIFLMDLWEEQQAALKLLLPEDLHSSADGGKAEKKARNPYNGVEQNAGAKNGTTIIATTVQTPEPYQAHGVVRQLLESSHERLESLVGTSFQSLDEAGESKSNFVLPTDEAFMMGTNIRFPFAKIPIDLAESAEQTIAGFLSAYQLTGMTLFMDTATDLALRLVGALRTATGFPLPMEKHGNQDVNFFSLMSGYSEAVLNRREAHSFPVGDLGRIWLTFRMIATSIATNNKVDNLDMILRAELPLRSVFSANEERYKRERGAVKIKTPGEKKEPGEDVVLEQIAGNNDHIDYRDYKVLVPVHVKPIQGQTNFLYEPATAQSYASLLFIGDRSLSTDSIPFYSAFITAAQWSNSADIRLIAIRLLDEIEQYHIHEDVTIVSSNIDWTGAESISLNFKQKARFLIARDRDPVGLHLPESLLDSEPQIMDQEVSSGGETQDNADFIGGRHHAMPYYLCDIGAWFTIAGESDWPEIGSDHKNGGATQAKWQSIGESIARLCADMFLGKINTILWTNLPEKQGLQSKNQAQMFFFNTVPMAIIDNLKEYYTSAEDHTTESLEVLQRDLLASQANPMLLEQSLRNWMLQNQIWLQQHQEKLEKQGKADKQSNIETVFPKLIQAPYFDVMVRFFDARRGDLTAEALNMLYLGLSGLNVPKGTFVSCSGRIFRQMLNVTQFGVEEPEDLVSEKFRHTGEHQRGRQHWWGVTNDNSNEETEGDEKDLVVSNGAHHATKSAQHNHGNPTLHGAHHENGSDGQYDAQYHFEANMGNHVSFRSDNATVDTSDSLSIFVVGGKRAKMYPSPFLRWRYHTDYTFPVLPLFAQARAQWVGSLQQQNPDDFPVIANFADLCEDWNVPAEVDENHLVSKDWLKSLTGNGADKTPYDSNIPTLDAVQNYKGKTKSHMIENFGYHAKKKSKGSN